MKQLHYNPIRSGRIKNLVMGIISILLSALFLYYVSSNYIDGGAIDKIEVVLIFAPLILVVVALSFVPFAQILESNDGELMMYYRLGTLQFKQQKLGKAKEILLEQNELRYYCVRIQLTTGRVIEMEKYPTLDWASIRYEEYKNLID